jgi:hypothetical protein
MGLLIEYVAAPSDGVAAAAFDAGSGRAGFAVR